MSSLNEILILNRIKSDLQHVLKKHNLKEIVVQTYPNGTQKVNVYDENYNIIHQYYR